MNEIKKGDFVKFKDPDYIHITHYGRVLHVPSAVNDWFIVTDGGRTYKISRAFIVEIKSDGRANQQQ